MARRTTPRPAEEARAIARMLRERFISQEAEAVACIALARLAPPLSQPQSQPSAPDPKTLPAPQAKATGQARVQPPLSAFSGSKKAGAAETPQTLIAMIRKREGIEDPHAPLTFSDEEKRQARQILDEILRRYRA